MDKPSPHQCAIVFSTVAESSVPMFWLRGSEFYLFNEAFLELTGYTREELEGKRFEDIHHVDNAMASLDDMHPPDGRRQTTVLTWVMRTKAGEPAAMELRITRFFAPGEEVPYYHGVSQKTSLMRKPSDVTFAPGDSVKLALEAAGQGMFEYNGLTEEFLFSEELQSLLGYSDFTSDFHPIWMDSLHPEDKDRLTDHWKHFLAGQTDHVNFKFRMRHKKGHYLWLTSRCVILAYMSDGRALRVAGVIRDMVNEHRYVETIASQAQRLMDYTYLNSHHIRGPLTSILGLTELMERECSPELVRQLKQAAQKLDHVVHRINHTLTGDFSASPQNPPPHGTVK